jgi:hypothetical protein
MLTIILLALGGAAAITALALTRGGSASASPMVVAAPLVFEPEVVTHSPEYLARQAEAKSQPAKAVPTTAGRRILIIGDSITATGYYKYVTVPGAQIKGKGWGGQQAVYIARHAKHDEDGSSLLDSFKPSDIVLLAGVNNVASEVVTAVKKNKAYPEILAAKVERDLATAWKLLHESGARVWAGTMTPWFGYTKYFGTGKATAEPMREVHRLVNEYIVSMRGKPGGPDEVIDTSEMGDTNGALLSPYTKDDLHPRTLPGQKALAGIVERALRGGPKAAVVGGILTVEVFDATVGRAVSESLERGY